MYEEPLQIYLTNPSGQFARSLNYAIDETTTSLSPYLNQQYELTFTINKTVDGKQVPEYNRLREGMYLAVEKYGLFKMNQPEIDTDGTIETKTIIAYSCDNELEDKILKISINTGLETSMEYLVEYDKDETELLVNPYTGIPYDWIVLYNTFPEQLNILKGEIQDGYYGDSDNNGNIIINDSNMIQEINQVLTLIPRLKSKFIKDENGDDTLEDYISYSYDSSGEYITEIILYDTFISRIDELITFYTKYRDQLSLLPIVLEQTEGAWTVGEIYGIQNGDFSLANKKYQFEIDENIYSFLTQTLAQTIECLVNFNIKHRKVNVTPVDKLGKNTGIILSYSNLLNSMSISCDENSLNTRLYVEGADGLSIEQVNFGSSYIDDITYKLNARDENGKRIYVSDELAEKYLRYIDYREEQRVPYIEATKEYNSYLSKISEIKNRVPNDSLKIEWGTYSEDELQQALTSYTNLLNALIAMYKETYGDVGINDDGTVNKAYIKNTEYWYDYEAYNNTITQINVALEIFPYYGDTDKWSSKWTDEEIEAYQNAISAWETEWSLFGSDELEAKIKSYDDKMNVLIESEAIVLKEDSDEAKTWNELTDSDKKDYGKIQSVYESNYQLYKKYYDERNEAQSYLDDVLIPQVEEFENKQSQADNQRKEIMNLVSLKANFTEEEIKTINLLYRDASYKNENILITNLNNEVSTVDIQLELLKDAQEKLSIYSRPQLNFSIEADNLFGIEEFKPLQKDFVLGNYVLVEYKDGTYVKLRLVGYSFNPSISHDPSFEISFSNFIRSKNKITDLESLLGMASGSVSSSYSSGGGRGGTYGESDDIDVTISNTMLSKLLNTELFGTRVRDVVLDTIDVKTLNAKTAKFGGLANGVTEINGQCLQTGWIIDKTYNGDKSTGVITNTTGSILNLENGYFNFGGGLLKWDGSTLSVKGKIEADSGKIAGYTINGDMLVGSSVGMSGKSGQGYAFWAGSDTPASAPFRVNHSGRFISTTGTIGGWDITSSGITKDSRDNTVYMLPGTNSNKDVWVIRVKDSNGNYTWPFVVRADGSLIANKANISGNITTKEKLMFVNGNDSTSIGYGSYSYNAGGVSEIGTGFMVNGDCGFTEQTYFTKDAWFNAGLNVVGESRFNGATVHKWAVANSNSNAGNVHMTTAGYLRLGVASSMRYKHDITKIKEASLDPKRLLELPIVQYKYNDGYLSEDDNRYDKFIPGFIAEDVEKYYPIAADYEDDGKVNDWNFRIIIPPMLALIQNNNKEIELLKQENKLLRDIIKRAGLN